MLRVLGGGEEIIQQRFALPWNGRGRAPRGVVRSGGRDPAFDEGATGGHLPCARGIRPGQIDNEEEISKRVNLKLID